MMSEICRCAVYFLFVSVAAVSYHEKMCSGTLCMSLSLTACVLFDKIWSYNASVEIQPFISWSAVFDSWSTLATGWTVFVAGSLEFGLRLQWTLYQKQLNINFCHLWCLKGEWVVECQTRDCVFESQLYYFASGLTQLSIPPDPVWM